MSYHRLLEAREIDGRVRLAGALLDYGGAPVPCLEPLGVAQHSVWLRALAAQRQFEAIARAA